MSPEGSRAANEMMGLREGDGWVRPLTTSWV